MSAFRQVSIHGKKTTGGRTEKNTQDGIQRSYQRLKEVCPLCDSVTLYLSTHLLRIHKLAKTSEEYIEAMANCRRYLGRKKEMKEVEKSVRKAKQPVPKKKTKTPLEILEEEASISYGEEVDYNDVNVIPPTPTKDATDEGTAGISSDPAARTPPPHHHHQQHAPADDAEDSGSSYSVTHEDDDEDEEEEFATLKEYYKYGVAKSDKEKLYLMFC